VGTIKAALFILYVFSFGFISMAHALCVTSSKTNLRSGPGPSHPVTWTVAKYTPLIEVTRKGNWIEVEDQDGENHWVYRPNVTSKMVCVSVRVPVAKLRKSPGAQGEVAELKQVDKYTPFKRVDAQDEWYEVESSWGETFWVHESTMWRPIRVSKVKF
jgi:SH3-like domain-containing protein